PQTLMACGTTLYDTLLSRGHFCEQSRDELLRDARARFTDARFRLEEMAREIAGSWEEAQTRFAADHPPARDFLDAFTRTWNACHESASTHDLVTWPDWPLRYVWIPSCTRD